MLLQSYDIRFNLVIKPGAFIRQITVDSGHLEIQKLTGLAKQLECVFSKGMQPS